MAKKVEVKQRFMNNNAKSKDYGRIAYLYKRDEKSGQVILIYEDGNGHEGPTISSSTLKRWWKKVNEDAPQDPEVADKAEDTEAASDGTAYSQVMQEIIEDGKKRGKKAAADKASKKASKKKAAVPDVNTEEICDFVFAEVKKLDGEIFEPAGGIKMRAFKIGGRMFAKFNFSSKGVTLACRSAAVSLAPDRTINHLFNNLYIFTSLDKDSKTKITTLLHEAWNNQVSKNNSKKKED